MAKAVVREQKRSLGNVVSDFIIGSRTSVDDAGAEEAQPAEFPTFRCIRRVTSEDVEALEDE